MIHSGKGASAMTLRDAVISGFEDFLRFAGRTSRRRFLLWLAAAAGSLAVATAIDLGLRAAWAADGAAGGAARHPAILVWLIAVLPPTLAMAGRRLHDAGRSAAWLWLLAAPVAGWLWLAWLLSRPGVGRTNRHGEPPDLLERM